MTFLEIFLIFSCKITVSAHEESPLNHYGLHFLHHDSPNFTKFYLTQYPVSDICSQKVLDKSLEKLYIIDYICVLSQLILNGVMKQ